MLIALSQGTRELAFKKLLSGRNKNDVIKNYIEIDEIEARRLISILDDIIQDGELDKILNKEAKEK